MDVLLSRHKSRYTNAIINHHLETYSAILGEKRAAEYQSIFLSLIIILVMLRLANKTVDCNYTYSYLNLSVMLRK